MAGIVEIGDRFAVARGGDDILREIVGADREEVGVEKIRRDLNPTKEEVEYVDSIMEDVRWLGFEWDDRCTTRRTIFSSSTTGPCR